MNNGWIKIHRTMLEWEHFKEPSVVTVYITLLLSADRDGNTDISLDGLASVTGLSKNTIRGALTKLVDSGEITRELVNGKKTITSITNWSEYQGGQKVTSTVSKIDTQEGQKLIHTGSKIDTQGGQKLIHTVSKIDTPHIIDDKNVQESKQEDIVDDARACAREKLVDEVKSDAAIERGCMSLGIDRQTYLNLAEQVFIDWDFQCLDDSGWTKLHFLSVMRYKVKDYKKQNNGQRQTNCSTGNPGDARAKLFQDGVKAMAALAAESRNPVDAPF